MKKKTFYGSIAEDGTRHLPSREIAAAFDDFAGKKVRIIITEHWEKRSNPLNAYYWAGVINDGLLPYLQEWDPSWSAERIHDVLKEKFLPAVYDHFEIDRLQFVARNTGEVYRERMSTTKLPTPAFFYYLELIRSWAWEDLGIEIKDPLPKVEKETVHDIDSCPL